MLYAKPTVCGVPNDSNSKELDVKRETLKPLPLPSMQEVSSDSLPVVELSPFTRHVWRREKSFPEFYHHQTDVIPDSREKVFHSDPLPNIDEVLTDITQSTNKFKECDLKRTKAKLHPTMPNINVALTGKPSGIIASFITKDDRTKTTFFLANQEENPKSYSCRKQALNSATIRRQQQLMLNGDPMSLPENMPNQFVYLNPLVHYRNTANLRQMRYRQSQHSSAPSDDRIKHMKSIPGKELDIMGILQRRSAKARLRPISAGKRYVDRQNGLIRNNVLGSSLDFLKIDTKPTIIEKQLNDDRVFHLQQCRRNIDIGYTSLEILQHLQSENAITRSLTQGEIQLKRGKDSNKIRGVREASVLAPVVEPWIQRGKMLSIRKCGPDPIVITREKSVLATVLTAKKYKESVVSLGNHSKRSDESMTSDNGDQRMDEGPGDHNGSDCGLSPHDDEETDRDGGDGTKKSLIFKNHETMDQESPVLEAPIRDSNYATDISSHCDSPLIELVAQANTNVSKSRLGDTPVLDMGNLFEIVTANNSQSNNQKHNTVEILASPTSTGPLLHQNNLLNSDRTIKRRPKACAFDDEGCDKHRETDIELSHNSDEQSDNHNELNSGVENDNSSVVNTDTSVVNNDTSVVYEKSSVVNNNIANDNGKHDSEIQTELNVHDKQTQADSGDVVDGNDDAVNCKDVNDDKLLKSTTFLTSDI